jgi:transposase
MMEESLESRRKELEAKGYKPKRLAVDEFAIHKGHTYATCVMDLDTGEVIWAGKGRSKEYFRHFFEDTPEDYLSEVSAVAMDRTPPIIFSSPKSCRRLSSSTTAITCRLSTARTFSALYDCRKPGNIRRKPRISSQRLRLRMIRSRNVS